jgi:hypothetical protein
VTEVVKYKAKDKRLKRHERIALLNQTLGLRSIQIITLPNRRLHKTSSNHFSSRRKKGTQILDVPIIVFLSKSAEDAEDSGTKQERRIRAQTTRLASKILAYSLRQNSLSLNHLLSLRVYVFGYLAKRIALVLRHTIVSAIGAFVMSSSVATAPSQGKFRFHATSGITVRIIVHIKHPMDFSTITETTRQVLSTVCAQYANSATVNESPPSKNRLFLSFDTGQTDGIYVYRDTQERIRGGRARRITCKTPDLQDSLPSSRSIKGSFATVARVLTLNDIENTAPTAITAATRIAIPSIASKNSSASSTAASDSTRVPTRTVPPDAHPQILPMII